MTKKKATNRKRGAVIRSTVGLGINGLHLWEVSTNRTRTDENLWITTAKKDTKQAVDKAVRFVRLEAGKKDEVTVTQLKYRGTLDA